MTKATTLLRSTLVVPIAVGLLAAGAATASAAGAVPNAEYCEPTTTYNYAPGSFTWVASDSGQLVNTSAGTISKTYTHTSSESTTTTVDASVGVTAKFAVADINAKLGIAVAETASYTTTDTFTVTAGPGTTVSYQNGLIDRQYAVTRHTLYSNCDTADELAGYVHGAQNYSTAS